MKGVLKLFIKKCNKQACDMQGYKMLKRVLFNLQINKKEQSGFVRKINELGLDCVKYLSLEQIHNRADCIVITDKEKDVAVIKGQTGGMNKEASIAPVIAYENSAIEKQDLFKADLLIEDLNGIDLKLLNNTYLRFYKKPVVIAKTERLIIREMKLGDLDELYKLYEPAVITEFLEPLYENREEEEEYLKAYIENMYGFYGYGMWALVEKESNRLIGRAGLNNRVVDGEIQIELGYMVGVPYQRKGYAYEAAVSILKFAKAELECEFVNCFVNKNNTPSIALLKKLGFKYKYEAEIEGEMLSLYRWTYKQPEVII